MNKNNDTPGGVGDRSAAATLAMWIAAILTVLVLVPFSTSFPDGTIDSSWMHAMNFAVGKGLQFGRDINFTFGPLAAVYSKQYYPSTDTAMLAGSTLIAVSVFLCYRTIGGAARKPWLLALPFFASQTSMDPIFVGLPLLVLFASIKPAAERVVYVASLLLGMSAMAVLLIVKGSTIPTVVFCSAATLAVIWRKSSGLAVLSAAVFVATLLTAWVASGQAISNLPTYFIAQAPIISGYTDAMSTLGPASDIPVYALCALLLLWSVWELRAPYRSITLLATALFFFLCFKAAFVRHDGHAIAAAFATVFVAFLCLLWSPGRRTAVLLGIAALTWAFIASSITSVTPTALAGNFAAAVKSGAMGIANRFEGRFLFDNALELANSGIRAARPLPVLKGTVDLYPTDLSVLLASGNTWAPRPILQSYSAYTEGLARRNADHLRTAGPDHAFFTVAPIDHRYPSIDDGASWPTLLNQYRLSQIAGAYAVLSRDTSAPVFDLGPAASTSTVQMGELVDVPTLGAPVFVQIDVRPTAIGKVAAIAFKSPQLHLVAVYPDGKSQSYRYIAGMGQSGFVLAPTIASVTDFALLKSPNWKAYLAHRMPVKFGITGDSGTRFAWQGSVEVKFFKLPVVADAAIDAMLFPDPQHLDSLAGLQRAAECNIDSINSVDPGIQSHTAVTALLQVTGWAVVSGAKGIPNDAVSLALVRPDGSATIYPTHQVERRRRSYFRAPAFAGGRVRWSRKHAAVRAAC
jgi:hypothetical protein